MPFIYGKRNKAYEQWVEDNLISEAIDLAVKEGEDEYGFKHKNQPCGKNHKTKRQCIIESLNKHFKIVRNPKKKIKPHHPQQKF